MLQFDFFRWIDHIFFLFFFEVSYIYFANSNIISNQALEKREKLFFLNNFIIFTCLCLLERSTILGAPGRDVKDEAL